MVCHQLPYCTPSLNNNLWFLPISYKRCVNVSFAKTFSSSWILIAIWTGHVIPFWLTKTGLVESLSEFIDRLKSSDGWRGPWNWRALEVARVWSVWMPLLRGFGDLLQAYSTHWTCTCIFEHLWTFRTRVTSDTGWLRWRAMAGVRITRHWYAVVLPGSWKMLEMLSFQFFSHVFFTCKKQTLEDGRRALWGLWTRLQCSGAATGTTGTWPLGADGRRRRPNAESQAPEIPSCADTF